MNLITPVLTFLTVRIEAFEGPSIYNIQMFHIGNEAFNIIFIKVGRQRHVFAIVYYRRTGTNTTIKKRNYFC